MRITDIDLWQNVVKGPKVFLWGPPMRHYNKRSLPSEEVDQELKKSVNSESLINIPYGIDIHCCCNGHERYPRTYSIYGNHQQNAHYIALKQGFSVILPIHR